MYFKGFSTFFLFMMFIMDCRYFSSNILNGSYFFSIRYE